MTPLEQIESIVKKNIPTFYEMVQAHKATKEIIIMHTDAFGTMRCEIRHGKRPRDAHHPQPNVAMPAPENTCPDCGEYKKEEYELCYQCNRDAMAADGKICDCGQFKQPEYEECYECSHA